MTAEQLEASRAERMRLNGHAALSLEDAKTWIEETGLCLFQPKRQFASSIAPSFVEAVAGTRGSVPDPRYVALAEELLVRLETDGVAVRLNLLGQPGEQPDFVVAGWVLPYVYALRGDRDWRRSPQLTGSRQVSPLAVQAYKLLEAGDATIPALKQALGREVTEVAVLRAITELWQQLRIIPVVSSPGHAPKWQLLRLRFQKAIAEGASTSQVTAISVLASIYLQAVIAATMEEVELFLAPLTARSKIREVLRGLVATRQVHTIPLGHAPHFYVAGTLPEFSAPPTIYASSAMPASAYFLHSPDHEEEAPAIDAPKPAFHAPARPSEPPGAAEPHAARPLAVRKPAASGKSAAARPHFSRNAARSRDRKPAHSTTASHPSRRTSSEARPAASRSVGARSAKGSRTAPGARWNPKAPAPANGARHGSHAGNGSANGSSAARGKKPSAPAWGQHNGHGNGHGNGRGNGAKGSAKAGISAHGNGLPKGASAARNGSASRKDSRPDARSARSGREPALTASAKAGGGKRFGVVVSPQRETKKRR